MATEIDRLDRFKKAVSAEIDEKAAALVAEGEAEAARILSEAQTAVSADTRHMSGKAPAGGAFSAVRAASAAELEKKKSVLRRREELISAVFDDVKDRLTKLRATDDYFEFLKKAAEASGASSGSVIRLSPEDMRFEARLRTALGIEASFEPDSRIMLGGLTVYFPDRGIMSDRTFDTALEEQRKTFAAKNWF